jgi:insulysin
MSTNNPSRSLATVTSQDVRPQGYVAGVTVNSSNPLEGLPAGYEVHNTIEGAPSSAPFAVYNGKLETSTLDDRAYRLIRLQNGLEAMIVHDPETDKASAAMDIRVGHLSDPEELQGLAHFCEHLLFMGTEKYPRENEYSEYLSNHSGSSNAYTGMENTNYFFDVGHKHFEGALDRFAQFFLKPLFDPSCTEREIRAVDSEHKKNLQSDAWRSFQLEKSLSDPKHPYSHFGTGNAKTLWDDPRAKGMDVRDELIKFHDRYYSANVMKLAVLGRESLDTLTRWVVDRFSNVQNKGVDAPKFPPNPFTSEQLQTQYFFRSVKDIRLLSLTFPIPDQSPLFRTKPGQFISHFIGHEGQGSILSYLKSKGWANHLNAGAMNGADGFEFFKISMDLTADGLKHYDEVVAAIFRYINLLKQAPVPEWSFKEVQQLCDLAFRFKEKQPPSSYTSGLSSQMQMPYPREWVLSGPYLTREFDPTMIRELADCLSPANCRVAVAAQALPDGTTAWDKKERWYGTEYKITPLSQKILQDIVAAGDSSMSLPPPNSFIPTTFEIEGKPAEGQPKPVPTKRPHLARHTPLGRLWHKRDDRFFLPKANVFLLMRSPLIDATPTNAAKCRMLVELIKDALTEYSYDAELAGLGYNIEAQGDAIGLSVDGYNDKLPVLLRYVLEEFKKFKVDGERFELIRDQVRRAYQNFQHEAPYQHANYYSSYLTIEKIWTAEEKLSELERLSVQDLDQFLHDVCARLHLEMLVHGNISRTKAEELLSMSETILGARALSASEQVSARSLLLEPKTNVRYVMPVANRDNVNSGIEYYCQVGEPTDLNLNARLILLSQILNEPAFDQLRTKEQLGYLVFSGARKAIGSMGFRIIVQSERSSDYLESRIDAFYRDNVHPLLSQMTDEEFEGHRESLIRKRMEKVKNLFDESSRYWFHIHSGYYNFLQRERDVEALRRVSKQDVLELFERYIWPDSKEGRSKLTVHVQSQIDVPRVTAKGVDALVEACTSNGWTDATPSPEIVEQWKAQQVTVEAIKAHIIRDDKAANATQLTNTIDQIAKAHAASARDDAKLVRRNPNERDVLISNAAHFKASLQPSRAAVPVQGWDELAKEPTPDEAPLPVDSGMARAVYANL